LISVNEVNLGAYISNTSIPKQFYMYIVYNCKNIYDVLDLLIKVPDK
jgi:hypothetical protein